MSLNQPQWPSRLVPSERGQSIDGVITYTSDSVERPTALSADVASLSTGQRVAGLRSDNNDPGQLCLLKANHPIPSDAVAFYFEITVRNGGDITIGFVPKLDPGSFGLNGRDGLKFAGTVHGEAFTHGFCAGDVIGAGMVPSKGHIFFTRNGKMISYPAISGSISPGLVPAISLRGGASITVNFGEQPYMFNFDQEILCDIRTSIRKEIRSKALHSPHLHTLVRDFLVAHTYVDTLHKFDDDYGRRALPCLSDGEAPRTTHQVEVRKQIHSDIMSMKSQHAMKLVEDNFPCVLSSSTAVSLYLYCQCFIDKVLLGDLQGALALGRSRLQPLKGSKDPGHKKLLHDTLALLAYPDPTASCMSYLVSESHRSKAARVVNAAIVFHLSHISTGSPPVKEERVRSESGNGGDKIEGGGRAKHSSYMCPQLPQPMSVHGAPSVLERMLQQLHVVQDHLGNNSGMSFDVPFTLRDGLAMLEEA